MAHIGFDIGNDGDFKVENGIAYKWVNSSGGWVQQSPGPQVTTVTGVLYDTSSHLSGSIAPNGNYYIPIASACPANTCGGVSGCDCIPIGTVLMETSISIADVNELFPGALNALLNNPVTLGLMATEGVIATLAQNALGGKIQFNGLYSDGNGNLNIYFTNYAFASSSFDPLLDPVITPIVLAIFGICLLAGIIVVGVVVNNYQQNARIDSILSTKTKLQEANDQLLRDGLITSQEHSDRATAIDEATNIPSGSSFDQLIQLAPWVIGGFIALQILQVLKPRGD